MGNICFKIHGVGQGDLGLVLDDAPKFVEKHSAKEANINGGDQISTFATSRSTTSCSEFHSTRIANMLFNKCEFETELEFRKAHSKVHWSELSHLEGASSHEDSSMNHRQYFEKLKKDVHWGPFCSKVKNVVLGRKLGEGAQATIYEAEVTFAWNKQYLVPKRQEYVVKVMKGDYALEDLQRQWPHGIGNLDFQHNLLHLHGALVKEPGTERNKFGFVMQRFGADLRSFIDVQMERKNAKGPPFLDVQATYFMYRITENMSGLHKRHIIHRDLKASNILVFRMVDDVDLEDDNVQSLYVADWECSLGVVGTGWWRAPEILLQLKNGIEGSKLEFNEKVDVYSFAMTCYEIVTGLIPFEGLPNSYELRDAILNGSRPELPHDLDLRIRAMITSCWDPNPSLRPSFDKLKQISKDIYVHSKRSWHRI